MERSVTTVTAAGMEWGPFGDSKLPNTRALKKRQDSTVT